MKAERLAQVRTIFTDRAAIGEAQQHRHGRKEDGALEAGSR
jgi:hypothetical protein